MRLLAPLSVLGLLLLACSSTPARRAPGPYGQPYPPGYGPPPGQYLPGQYQPGQPGHRPGQFQAQPQVQPGYAPGYGPPPGYPPGPPPGHPGAPPVVSAQPTASLAPAPSANLLAAPPPEVEVCLAPSGKKSDCKTALERAAPPGPVDNLKYSLLYKRGCELKVQLLGCGAFKSKAVGEGDHETMVALMRCEMGVSESCEGLETKSAPLKAWHTTLKADGCKKGANALCKSHKECKLPSQWSCEPSGAPAAAGQEAPKACGCFPRCSSGVSVALTGKTWPDGSQRAKFSCNP